MKSNEYLDLVLDQGLKKEPKILMKLNACGAQLEAVKSQESEEQFFSDLREIHEKNTPLLLKQSFLWTQAIGIFFKNFFFDFQHINFPLFYEFGNIDYLAKNFTQYHVRIFCESKIGKVGGSVAYDELMRALSRMMEYFLNVHVNKFLIFKPRLKTSCIHLYDPCYRERVRMRNRNDPEIINKFSGEDFDLKPFVFLGLNKFFPNVSWRWIGGKQFAHLMVLKVIVKMFEYGLWRIEDLEALLEKTYMVSEILINLEKYISRDTKNQSFTMDTAKEWSRMATNCRLAIASIYLHIVIMYHDYNIMNTMPQFELNANQFFPGEPLYKAKSLEDPDTLFKIRQFKRKRFYTYVGFSLACLLCKTHNFEPYKEKNFSKRLDVLINLLITYVNQNRNSFYYVSLDTFQPHNLPFYLLADNSSIHAEPDTYVRRFKKINDMIRNGNFDEVSVDSADGIQQVKDVFKDITNFFSQSFKHKEQLAAHQLAFVMADVPHYVLSLINLIISLDYKEHDKKVIMRDGFAVLLHLAKSNTQTVTNLFSGYNFDHIQEILSKDKIHSTYFFAKIFNQSSSFPIIEGNAEVFDKIINAFESTFKKFLTEFKDWVSNPETTMDVENLTAFVILNKLFKSFLSNRTLKNYRFEIIFSSRMNVQYLEMLRAYAQNQIRLADQESSKSYVYYKFNNILRELSEWNFISQYDRNLIVNEVFNRSLKVFARSVARIVTPPIFDSFYPVFKTDLMLDKFVYLLDAEAGQRTLGTIIHLYSIFVIFYQNNLLNHSQVQTEDVKNFKQEYLTSKQVEPWISTQLAVFCQPLQKLLEVKGINEVLRDFLLKSYMPVIFKYLSGLFAHMNDEEFVDIIPSDRKQIFKNMKLFAGLVNSIEKCFASKDGEKVATQESDQFLYTFITNQRLKNPVYCYPKSFYDSLDEVRDYGSELMVQISSLYLWDESKVKCISSFVRFDNNSFQEKAETYLNDRLEGHMVETSAEFKQMHHARRVAWRKVRTSAKEYEEMQIENNQMAEKTFNVIKYFDFEIFSDTEFVMYTHSINNDVDLKAKRRMGGNWIEASKVEAQQRLAAKIINYMKIRYIYMKDYFIKRPQMNQILHVLKMEDIIKNNVQNLIEYFIYKMTFMDADFKNPEQSYLASDTYKLLLVLMDTLIRSSRNYRMAFYKHVKEGQEAIIHRIFSIHKFLVNFVTYKTFIDDNWCEMYVWYHLFSNFLQNLCEDNFANFKNWFFHEKLSADDSTSLLIDYNNIIDRAFKYNQLPDVDKEFMRINDRPEMVMVYERLVIGITEFVNGGKTLGQAILYEKQIDIWVGITLRVIEDVDSKFYQLKDAIVTYLTALVDGENQGPVDFIASNFSASAIFKIMVRLIKKLYVRQMIFKKERRRKFWNRNSAKMVSIISAKDEDICTKITFDSLIEYYKKYDETFSEHVIINTVVNLYSFLNFLGDQVVRYENFLKELNIIKDSFFVHKQKFKNETYDLTSITIWYFISKIIVEMEIKYKDKFSDEKEPKLVLHRFKKLPLCFFLTSNVKDEFMENVNVDSLDFKHEAFFEKSKDHLIIMGDLRRIFIKSKLLYYTSTNDAFMWYMKALYAICIVINVMFLFLYNKTPHMFKNLDPTIFDSSINYIAIIHAAISFALLLYWFFMKYPTVVKIAWESYYTTRSRKKKVPLWHRFKVQIIDSISIMTVPRNFFLQGLLAVLGRVINPFFYTLMLLLVVDLSILANSVVISFVQNYDKLGYTLLMILFVINVFAFLAADFFEDAFESESKSQFICNTYFSCLMNSLDIGVRTGGGIADKMMLEGSTESNLFGGRFLFDVVFFILINVILLGIFFGIIVDSFKAYRDEMVKRAKDKENICFTCGLSKTTLEKSGIEFDKHQEEHGIWNYFFYTIYLKWKPVNSYDGVDIYIDENLESNNRNGWMPIMTTMKYEKRQKEINQGL
jgi:hypothetical protein